MPEVASSEVSIGVLGLSLLQPSLSDGEKAFEEGGTRLKRIDFSYLTVFKTPKRALMKRAYAEE
ncbi:hypothetical protein A3K79_00865 [Candidatus Bathyarchaeota archaeon RBG_13_46_16b]|nr:MAG: hypothetical protein A3K79_00865 [Candidatus Bathyarchaeota archaeon RBG_13_46_16b]